MIYIMDVDAVTEQERPRISRYNPNDNAWHPVSHMFQNRSAVYIFEYDGILYAIWEEEEGSRCIERYDDKTEEFLLVC